MTKGERYFWLGVVAVLVVLLLIERCSNEQGSAAGFQPEIDTVYQDATDTLPEYTPRPDTIYLPKPVFVKGKDSIIYQTDSFAAWQPVDTAAILKDYYSTVYYQDSAVIQHGKVFINDSVRENRIVSRYITTRLQVPVITNTVTIVEPAKNKVFFSISGATSRKLNYGAGKAGFLFLTKRDLGIEAQTGIDTYGNWIFEGGVKLKLSFKK